MGAPRLWRCRLSRHRPAQRRGPCGRPRLCHPAAAAQRHRHAAHGPRLQPDHHGQPHALPPHDGLQHRLGPRHRPRRHRHANRRRAPAAGTGHQPSRHGPHPARSAQELRLPGLGVEGTQRQHHHQPDAPHGCQRRLEPRILHHGRQAQPRRHRNLCPPVRAGPDLPRQASGQLGSGAQVRRLRPRSRKRRGRRPPVAHRLPADGRQRQPDRGHHPPRNHAWRRCRHGPPRR